MDPCVHRELQECSILSSSASTADLICALPYSSSRSRKPDFCYMKEQSVLETKTSLEHFTKYKSCPNMGVCVTALPTAIGQAEQKGAAISVEQSLLLLLLSRVRLYLGHGGFQG